MQLPASFPRLRRFALGFAVISAALVVMAPLAACGGSSSTTGSTTTSSGPVNLTFWSWVPGIDKSVALWNKSHPNIHVTLNNVGSGSTEYDKLYTAIKANNEPDLGQVEYQLLPTFETTNSLVDMSQYGASDAKSDFVPWTWSQVPLATRFTQSHKILARWQCSIGKISSQSIISPYLPPGHSTPMMLRNCMPLTLMSTSPTSHLKKLAGSQVSCGKMVGICSALMANPGRFQSIILLPNRSQRTGKQCSIRSLLRPMQTSQMVGIRNYRMVQ